MNKSVLFGIILFLIIFMLDDMGFSQSTRLQNYPISKINLQQFKITLSDSWLSRDKTHHFLTSAFLSGAGYYFLREEKKFSNNIAQKGGIFFSLSLGITKEIRDGFKPNNAFSVKDLVADILGTAVGILLISDLQI